ncbi:unnamed protein product [marine sediment metagenome]|uniref:Uncharacterized protein n=1 Tax=marine sediment metagenome TaxID=412755 RepID=X1H1C0_9ZZZZ
MTRTEKLIESQQFAIKVLEEKAVKTKSRIGKVEIESHLEQLRSTLVSLVNFNANQETKP